MDKLSNSLSMLEAFFWLLPLVGGIVIGVFCCAVAIDGIINGDEND